MSAGELFKAGRLREAIEAQTVEVKGHPTDSARRLLLFELLAFAGDLDRARKQIDAIRFDEPELQSSVLIYHGLQEAEAKRRAFFLSGTPAPQFLVDPPPHVSLRLDAIARQQAGDTAGAAALLDQANAELPAIQGTINGQPLENFRDVDDRFGTVLEVMAHGGYYWVPIEQVVSLTMEPPRFPRNLLWFPARIELEETAGEVFLSTLYPSSHTHEDELVKLGRMTDWHGDETGPTIGSGLRTFLIGDDSIGILEWRELIVEHEQTPPPEAES